MYQGTSVASDSDTKGLLYDWFQFREINYENEDKFLAMYRRNIEMFYPKYLLLLEDELKEIPELVNYKREITGQLRNYGSITDEIVREITNEQNRTDDLSRVTDMTSKNTGNVSTDTTDHSTGSSRTDNQLNQNITESSSGSTSESGTTNTSGSNASTGHDRARGMLRELPQSIEYGGAGQTGFDATGYPQKFDWDTATHQAEDVTDTDTLSTSENTTTSSSDGSSENSMHNNLTNTGYSTSSNTNDDTSNTTQNLNTQVKDEGTVRDTGTQKVESGTDENTTNTRRLDDKHDSFSTQKGFYGMTEAELRKAVWNFIANSIASQWFISKLEICFMGIFE